MKIRNAVLCAAVTFVLIAAGATIGRAQDAAKYAVNEGDYVTKDFKFRSGESLPELRLHYRTLGKPVRDDKGRVTNAVLILHGKIPTWNNFVNHSSYDDFWKRHAVAYTLHGVKIR